MSHLQKQSLLIGDTCPMCRRRYEDMADMFPKPRHLSIQIGNDEFELKFTGNVCQDCYHRMTGSRQQAAEPIGYGW